MNETLSVDLDNTIRTFYPTGLDLDTRIYRFMPWRWVRDLLVEGNFALVRPESWQDPYELVNRPAKLHFSDGNSYRGAGMIPESNLEVFSQSWTTRDMADTMLRAYSTLTPDNDDGVTFDPEAHAGEAVQISTTIRKLNAVVSQGARQLSGFVRQYVADVQYLPDQEIVGHVAELIKSHGPAALNDPDVVATMLRLKRDAYHAELEVRPIMIFDSTARQWPLAKWKIDPHELIETISIDPRVRNHKVGGFQLHSAHNRETFLGKCGFGSKVVESRLYSGSPVFELTMSLDQSASAEWEAWLPFMEKNRYPT